DRKPIGADRAKEDGAQIVFHVLIDNLNWVIKREPSGGHQGRDLINTYDLTRPLQVAQRYLMAVVAGSRPIRIMEKLWSIKRRRNLDLLLAAVLKYVVGRLGKIGDNDNLQR